MSWAPLFSRISSLKNFISGGVMICPSMQPNVLRCCSKLKSLEPSYPACVQIEDNFKEKLVFQIRVSITVNLHRNIFRCKCYCQVPACSITLTYTCVLMIYVMISAGLPCTVPSLVSTLTCLYDVERIMIWSGLPLLGSPPSLIQILPLETHPSLVSQHPLCSSVLRYSHEGN